jgi:hypothetical protein
MHRIALFHSLTLSVLLLGSASLPLGQTLVRAPYLQMGTPTTATLCWRISTAIAVEVRYGMDAGKLAKAASQPPVGTDACLTLNGLQPATRYYYSLFNGASILAGGNDYYFETHPVSDAKKRTIIWVVGDAGTGYADQAKTRDAFYKVNGGAHAEAILFLGDNAYQDGTDAELTKNHFAPYADILRNTFSWTTLGNHDAYGPTKEAPHLAAWNLPTMAEAGGVASGSELYYSFDQGNIHYICLDSQRSDRTKAGPMYKWLEADLTATRKDWIIAFFHHAPYTFGSHNSDLEEKHPDMRATFGPLLEKYGVDMVFCGHSHGYERSFLINGATGNSVDNKAKLSQITLDAKSGNPTTPDGPYLKKDARAGNLGTVYVVAGSASQIETKEVPEKHPVMYTEHVKLGTVMLAIEDRVATGFFIDQTGAVLDQFQIVQGEGPLRRGDVVPKHGRAPFEKKGRNLVFGSQNWDHDFQIWDGRGSLKFQGKTAKTLFLTSEKFPPGLYHYRTGLQEGRLLLQ